MALLLSLISYATIVLALSFSSGTTVQGVPTVERRDCAHDNCLRALIGNGVPAQDYCASLSPTQPLPSFAAPCTDYTRFTSAVLVCLPLLAQPDPRARRCLQLLLQHGNTRASLSQSRSSTMLPIKSRTTSSHGPRLSAQCWHTIFRLPLERLVPTQQLSAGRLQPRISGAILSGTTQWRRTRMLWRGGSRRAKLMLTRLFTT